MRRSTALVLVSLSALAGSSLACSKSQDLAEPKVVAEPRDAAPSDAQARDATAPADAGVVLNLPPSSVFSVVARAPTIGAVPYEQAVAGDRIAAALPYVRRLPNGGLVVASIYARAQADGPGPPSVELLGRGLEGDLLFPYMEPMGAWARRWVWIDASTTVLVDETETGRGGPRLSSLKLGPNGFTAIRGSRGYWSAVSREGSVLALEREAYEIPNSSIYPKGSGYEQNEWSVRPARVAVLSGKGPAPVLPAGVCAHAMSAAPDGSLAITVDKCKSDDKKAVGVVRYAPGATKGALEMFQEKDRRGRYDHDDVVVFAAGAGEIYVGDYDDLHTWNGSAWSKTTPVRGSAISSISRSPSGDLWIATETGLKKRAAADEDWLPVGMPLVPTDPLDEAYWAEPDHDGTAFRKTKDVPERAALRRPEAGGFLPRLVDAAGDEVLVVATVDHEAFVMSTRAREGVARLPSHSVQRAKLAQTLKRKFVTALKDCRGHAFLVLADGTTADRAKAAIGASADVKAGEAVVEDQKRLVLFGPDEPLQTVLKGAASLSPRIACGVVAVEREL